MPMPPDWQRRGKTRPSWSKTKRGSLPFLGRTVRVLAARSRAVCMIAELQRNPPGAGGKSEAEPFDMPPVYLI